MICHQRKFVFLLLMLISAGCVPPTKFSLTPTPIAGTQLAVETIAYGTYCHSLDTEVLTYFITNQAELDEALSQMFPADQAAPTLPGGLIAIDFGANAVIAALRRCYSSSNYQVVIDSVVWRPEEDKLLVYVQLWDPTYSGGTAAETGYYHIVKVPWTTSTATNIKLELITYPMFHTATAQTEY
jgi:hypothetical protein